VKPPFAWYFATGIAAAVLVPVLPVWIGGVHGYQSPALLLTTAWFALFALGLVLYGRRALWLLIASPPALLWLYVVGMAIICDGGRCG
jgi:hypothetical protein